MFLLKLRRILKNGSCFTLNLAYDGFRVKSHLIGTTFYLSSSGFTFEIIFNLKKKIKLISDSLKAHLIVYLFKKILSHLLDFIFVTITYLIYHQNVSYITLKKC